MTGRSTGVDEADASTATVKVAVIKGGDGEEGGVGGKL